MGFRTTTLIQKNHCVRDNVPFPRSCHILVLFRIELKMLEFISAFLANFKIVLDFYPYTLIKLIFYFCFRLPNLSCQEPWELIRSISPNPTHKFLSPNHVQLAHPTSRWSQAMSHLLHHGSTSSWSGQDPTKAQTSSLLLVIRGSPTGMETFSPPGQWNALETKLKKAYGAVEWNPFPVDCWRSYEKGFGHLKQATIVANSSAVLDYLVGVRERAKVMWENGAYLHWYERYGCDKDTFTDAFAVMDTIIDSYINM